MHVTEETECVLDKYSSSVTSFSLSVDLTTLAGKTNYMNHPKDGYYNTREWYSTAKIEVYNDGELITSSDYAPIPSYPAAPSGGGTNTNTLDVTLKVEWTVETIGVLLVKVIPIHSYYVKNIVTVIRTLSYNTDEPIIVSTGAALFIATTGVNGGYTTLESGAYRALRNQVR